MISNKEDGQHLVCEQRDWLKSGTPGPYYKRDCNM